MVRIGSLTTIVVTFVVLVRCQDVEPQTLEPETAINTIATGSERTPGSTTFPITTASSETTTSPVTRTLPVTSQQLETTTAPEITTTPESTTIPDITPTETTASVQVSTITTSLETSKPSSTTQKPEVDTTRKSFCYSRRARNYLYVIDWYSGTRLCFARRPCLYCCRVDYRSYKNEKCEIVDELFCNSNVTYRRYARLMYWH